MLIRVSARAKGPPGQACGPRPNAKCSLAFGAVHPELLGMVEMTRVPSRGAVEHHDGGAGRDRHPADAGGRAGEPEVTLDRALEP